MAFPQPPQYRGTAAAMLSVGDDISDIGTAMLKGNRDRENSLLQYDLKLKELAKKHDLEMAEINARKEAELEKERLKRTPNESAIKGYMRELGVDETDKPEGDPTFRVAVDDESGGHTGTDAKKREKYVKNQREGGLMARMLAASDNPKQSQEAISEWRRRQLTLDAPDMPSALEGGRRMNTYQGDPENAVEGHQIINKFTRETKQTDLGNAMAADERASAGHHGASAGAQAALAEKYKKDNKSKTNDPAYRSVEAQYNRVSAEVTRLDTELRETRKAKNETMSSEQRSGYDSTLTRLEERLRSAEAKRDELANRLDSWSEGSPGAAGEGVIEFDNQGRRVTKPKGR